MRYLSFPENLTIRIQYWGKKGKKNAAVVGGRIIHFVTIKLKMFLLLKISSLTLSSFLFLFLFLFLFYAMRCEEELCSYIFERQ